MILNQIGFDCDQQGEAPTLILQDLQNGVGNGFELKNGTFKTATTIGDKTVLNLLIIHQAIINTNFQCVTTC